MAGYAVKLPIKKDSFDGYALLKDLRSLSKQNLKMVILTNPGERVMMPNFGAGIRRYLFENTEDQHVPFNMKDRITDQVRRYLPYIRINDVLVTNNYKNVSIEMSSNTYSIVINYTILPLNENDILSINL